MITHFLVHADTGLARDELRTRMCVLPNRAHVYVDPRACVQLPCMRVARSHRLFVCGELHHLAQDWSRALLHDRFQDVRQQLEKSAQSSEHMCALVEALWNKVNSGESTAAEVGLSDTALMGDTRLLVQVCVRDVFGGGGEGGGTGGVRCVGKMEGARKREGTGIGNKKTRVCMRVLAEGLSVQV